MKYTILINQKVLAKTKLDLKDAAILEYIRGWCQSDDPKVKQLTLREDGIDYKYTWINFNYLIEEMPLLYLKGKASVSERIENIKKAGFIKTFQSPENSLYVRLMPKIKELEFEGVAVRFNEQGVRPAEQGVFAQPNSTISILNQSIISDSAKKPNAVDVSDQDFKEVPESRYVLEEDEYKPKKNKDFEKKLKAIGYLYSKLASAEFGSPVIVDMGDLKNLREFAKGRIDLLELAETMLKTYIKSEKFLKYPNLKSGLTSNSQTLYYAENQIKKSNSVYVD